MASPCLGLQGCNTSLSFSGQNYEQVLQLNMEFLRVTGNLIKLTHTLIPDYVVDECRFLGCGAV
jgi:hypothetical protein